MCDFLVTLSCSEWGRVREGGQKGLHLRQPCTWRVRSPRSCPEEPAPQAAGSKQTLPTPGMSGRNEHGHHKPCSPQCLSLLGAPRASGGFQKPKPPRTRQSPCSALRLQPRMRQTRRQEGRGGQWAMWPDPPDKPCKLGLRERYMGVSGWSGSQSLRLSEARQLPPAVPARGQTRNRSSPGGHLSGLYKEKHRSWQGRAPQQPSYQRFSRTCERGKTIKNPRAPPAASTPTPVVDSTPPTHPFMTSAPRPLAGLVSAHQSTSGILSQHL